MGSRNVSRDERNREEEIEERLPHCVIQYFVDGLDQVNSVEVEKMKKMSEQFHFPADDIKSRMITLRCDLVKTVGIFEFQSVNLGTPEKQAAIISDTYIRKINTAENAEELAALLGEIYYAFNKACIESSLQRPRYHKIHNCMEYIENNTGTRIKLKELSVLFGYNPSYLCQRFKSETGMTITQYSRECRLKEAKTLLCTTNRTVSDISSALCFANQSHFHREFRKKYGITPNECRKNISN